MSVPRFTVFLSEAVADESRSARRVIVHPDILKTLKLCSGDVIALSQGDNGSAKKVRNSGTGNPLPLERLIFPWMTGLRGWGPVAVYRRFTEWQVPRREMVMSRVAKLDPVIMGIFSLQLSCYLLHCSLRRALRKVTRSNFFPYTEKTPTRITRPCHHFVMPKEPDTFVCAKFPEDRPSMLRPILLTPGSAEIGLQFYCANILVSVATTATMGRCGWHANPFQMHVI